MKYTISFIQAKVEVLDEARQSNNTDETVKSPPSTPITTEPSVSHIYLGSPKKETTVADFADGSAGNGLTYYAFRKMLEEFLNQYYKGHHERYLEVRGDQKVISKNLLLRLGH